MKCIFVSDLHGKKERYKLLQKALNIYEPDALFIGGDLLPGFIRSKDRVRKFLSKHLITPLENVRNETNKKIRCFVIMGNDDPRIFEEIISEYDDQDKITYVNQRCVELKNVNVCGYCFIPPTPFQLKDWEKYDVSRFIDVGAVSPEKGTRTIEIEKDNKKYDTIKKDLDALKGKSRPDKTIYLFHSPPYETDLDRADLDGEKIDHAPIDVHVGSIAIKKFIQQERPFLTLHGHVHETVDITGKWMCKIGDTICLTGVTSGEGLAVVRFDTENLEEASREVLKL